MFTGQGMIAAFGSLEITSEIILEFLQREGGRGERAEGAMGWGNIT